MSRREDNSHYVSLADIMTALMLIFLFVSVSVIRYAQKKYENYSRCEQITETYFDKKESLYEDLKEEFKRNLSSWNAEITPDLSFKFTEKSAQFNRNEAVLRPEFQEKLKEFFPRYIKTLAPYRDQIQEIRIEGHTDTTGPCDVSSSEICVMKDGPYMYNMGLSQARAKNVLAYCLSLTPDLDYVKQYITANGLSYSKLIKDSKGLEDPDASRRVEFKVLLKAEDNMKNIKGGF